MMSQFSECVNYIEEKEKLPESVVEIYKNAYAGDHKSKFKTDDTDMKTQQVVSLNQDKKVGRCYTLTVAWVILLCILFLAALGVLWITFSNMTTENNWLQISNRNLINQKEQVEKEKDGLQNKLNLIDRYATLGWVYFNSSSYYIGDNSTELKSWNDSRQDCLRREADLVIINSMDEENFVLAQLKRYNEAWIGLHNDGSEMVQRAWKWVDGTPLNISLWNNGEPNNSDKNEHCVEILHQQKAWNDEKCSKELVYICEMNLF